MLEKGKSVAEASTPAQPAQGEEATKPAESTLGEAEQPEATSEPQPAIKPTEPAAAPAEAIAEQQISDIPAASSLVASQQPEATAEHSEAQQKNAHTETITGQPAVETLEKPAESTLGEAEQPEATSEPQPAIKPTEPAAAPAEAIEEQQVSDIAAASSLVASQQPEATAEEQAEAQQDAHTEATKPAESTLGEAEQPEATSEPQPAIKPTEPAAAPAEAIEEQQVSDIAAASSLVASQQPEATAEHSEAQQKNAHTETIAGQPAVETLEKPAESTLGEAEQPEATAEPQPESKPTEPAEEAIAEQQVSDIPAASSLVASQQPEATTEPAKAQQNAHTEAAANKQQQEAGDVSAATQQQEAKKDGEVDPEEASISTLVTPQQQQVPGSSWRNAVSKTQVDALDKVCGWDRCEDTHFTVEMPGHSSLEVRDLVPWKNIMPASPSNICKCTIAMIRIYTVRAYTACMRTHIKKYIIYIYI